MQTPLGSSNAGVRDIAYSFTCEHCGKNSGWLVWRTNAVELEKLVEKGEFVFPEKCRFCGKKQSWGTKAVLRRFRNIWIGVAAFFSIIMLVGLILTLTGYDSTNLDFSNTFLMMALFFVVLSPIYLIPFAVRKIKDSNVSKKQIPDIRWTVNYIVGNNPSPSEKGNHQTKTNDSIGQKVNGIRELNNENFWHCPYCGRLNDGAFCTECGQKKLSEQKEIIINSSQGNFGGFRSSQHWKCPACETLNTGDFCIACGTKRK